MSHEEVAEVLRLEGEAEKKVMMGLCKGINLGLREALKRRYVFACATDLNLTWPECSYIKLVCDGEVVGEDLYDKATLENLKKKGNVVAGNLVLYKDKTKALKERRDEMRVHMLPMEIPELTICGAVVGVPSPPTDIYLKTRLEIDTEDNRLGTVVVGVD
ncbi:MAG: hypothetical protein FJZ49_07520 [Candidatus Verstraetearchaeota archaeon]|nr:hypothetical protein [Candidatus Verstraetearchaeota archaeon]